MRKELTAFYPSPALKTRRSDEAYGKAFAFTSQCGDFKAFMAMLAMQKQTG